MGLVKTYVAVNAPIYMNTGTEIVPVWTDISKVITSWKYDMKRAEYDVSDFSTDTKKKQTGAIELTISAMVKVESGDTIVPAIGTIFRNNTQIGLKFPIYEVESIGYYTISAMTPDGEHGTLAKYALTLSLAGDLVDA